MSNFYFLQINKSVSCVCVVSVIIIIRNNTKSSYSYGKIFFFSSCFLACVSVSICQKKKQKIQAK